MQAGQLLTPADGPTMLLETHPTLPSEWYYDPAHHQRELEAIWFRDWLCVGREDDWAETGDYRVVAVGDQQVIITRDGSGRLRAFHNTCRHRGSQLCTSASGRFERGRIVCPYHAWAYGLDGALQRTPRRVDTPDFRLSDYPLYGVAVEAWCGFVFICLAKSPQSALAASLAGEVEALANWPLAQLVTAHRVEHRLACNWKIFWENFLECYHCPGIHRDLCRVVPVYGQGLSDPDDLPEGSALQAAARHSHLAEGAVTWSPDGQSDWPWFEGLSEAEQARGMTFVNHWPSVFVVAHVDYVRSVEVMPLGPEETRLAVRWMLLPETAAERAADIPALAAFANQVVMEDARVCELNQRGLHSRRHQQGVLVGQEHDVQAFDAWVQQRLAAAGPGE